jgi:hypothetical protein
MESKWCMRFILIGVHGMLGWNKLGMGSGWISEELAC